MFQNILLKSWFYVDRLIHTQPKPKEKSLLDGFGDRRREKKWSFEDPTWVQTLKEQKHNLLFYYGDVPFFSESPAFTIEKHTLWRDNRSNVPIALKGSFTHEELPNTAREKVIGKLLLLKDNAIDDLDFEMQRGVHFERKVTSVVIPFKDWEGNPTRLTTWMYVGTPRMRDNILWDVSFYHGRRDFSLAPKLESAKQWIGKFYQHQNNSNKEALKKCYLYLHRGLNDPTPAKQPEPPTAKLVVEHVQAIPNK